MRKLSSMIVIENDLFERADQGLRVNQKGEYSVPEYDTQSNLAKMKALHSSFSTSSHRTDHMGKFVRK